MPESKSRGQLDGSEPPEVAIPLLVEKHGEQIFALGVRFCGDREFARDLVQETFLQAFRKWHQFQGRSQPSTWLYTIAANVCRRFHRKRAGEPRRMRSLEEIHPFHETTEPVFDANEEDAGAPDEALLREAERAIALLPAGFRMPLVLKEIAGLSLQEIAGVMDLKLDTVKTRLHRARLAVRKEIARKQPQRRARAPIFDRQVCLDLLEAKQDALDRGVVFEFPGDVVCERCAGVFASLDLAQDACRRVAGGELPASLKRALLERAIAEHDERKPMSKRPLPRPRR